MQDKQQALINIRSLMEQYQISIQDIQHFVSQSVSDKATPILTQLLAYLGGVLVLCGISIYVGMQWEQMSSLVRVLFTLGAGFVCYILALCAITEPRFNKAVTPLFILAFILETGGLFVLLDEYFTPTGNWEHGSMTVFGCVAIQFGFSFLALRRASLLFITILSGVCFTCSWFELLDMDEAMNAAIIGGGLLIGTFFIHRSRYQVITPLWYFIASVMFLVGLFEWSHKDWTEVFYVMANLGLIYMSIQEKSRTLLFTSIVGLFAYISYTAYEYFVDSIGWPIALILCGLVLFALSALGLKLNQRYIKS